MSQLTIHRYPATIHYFTEDLGSKVTIDMVLIPAGSFEMGSPENELECNANERPQHTVTVPTFFMGQMPITQAQWQQVAKLPKVKDDLKPNPSGFKGDNRPVEKVSWDDATEFCTRLSRQTETIICPARLNGNMPVVRAQLHPLFLVRRLMPPS